MTTIFDDGVLEATLYPNRWIFCRWIQNAHGRLQKRLIRDMFHMEQLIWTGRLNGWFTDSELEHTEFHRLLIRFGALPREIIGHYKRFIKPILKEGDIYVRLRAKRTPVTAVS